MPGTIHHNLTATTPDDPLYEIRPSQWGPLLEEEEDEKEEVVEPYTSAVEIIAPELVLAAPEVAAVAAPIKKKKPAKVDVMSEEQLKEIIAIAELAAFYFDDEDTIQ